jgi:CRISPR/Cas system CSM-associated protein Csm4 (group 5 of RAMP superfamily)
LLGFLPAATYPSRRCNAQYYLLIEKSGGGGEGDLIQGNLEVQSIVESSIAALDQSSILLVPSTCAPVSDTTKENTKRERYRNIL